MQGGTERGIIEHTKRRRRRRRGGMDHGWKDYGFRFTSLSQPVTRVVGLFSRIGGGWLKLEGGRGRERSLQAELLALTPSARAGEGEGERFPSGWVENLARPLPPPAPPEAEDSSSSFSRKPAPIRASQLLSSIFSTFSKPFSTSSVSLFLPPRQRTAYIRMYITPFLGDVHSWLEVSPCCLSEWFVCF